jgi:hypothetical protein
MKLELCIRIGAEREVVVVVGSKPKIIRMVYFFEWRGTFN